MYQEQGGRCSICLKGTDLVVDHDRKCCSESKSCGSCIRGLICDLCNRGLGYFHDSPDSLVRAASYLEHAPVLT
jgi:hypothetical protein